MYQFRRVLISAASLEITHTALWNCNQSNSCRVNEIIKFGGIVFLLANVHSGDRSSEDKSETRKENEQRWQQEIRGMQ